MLFKLILITLLNLTKTDHSLTLNTPENQFALYCESDSRPCDIARDIANVVEDYEKEKVLPFKGLYAKESTALALLAIAHHESGFRKEVQICDVMGDNGKSASLYQLHQGNSWIDLYRRDENNQPIKHSKNEICSDNHLATELSLQVLLRFPNYPQSMFYSYAGNDGKESKAGRELYHGWLTLLAKNNFYVDHKKGPRWIEKKQ